MALVATPERVTWEVNDMTQYEYNYTESAVTATFTVGSRDKDTRRGVSRKSTRRMNRG